MRVWAWFVFLAGCAAVEPVAQVSSEPGTSEARDDEKRAAYERTVAITNATNACVSAWSLEECDRIAGKKECRAECQAQMDAMGRTLRVQASVCKAHVDSTTPEPLRCELVKPTSLNDAGWERYQRTCDAICLEAWDAAAEGRKARAERIAEDLRANEEQQRRTLNIERAQREEEEERRKKRQQQDAAAAKARESNPVTPQPDKPAPVRTCGDRVQCCDGTCSPTCRDAHRGCCSHHGGVCG